MKGWIKARVLQLLPSVYFVSAFCKTVASVDSVLLQLRHLLQPNKAQAFILTRLHLQTVPVLVVTAGMSIICVKRLV